MTGFSYGVFPAEILLVGDHTPDVQLTCNAFRDSAISHRMHVVHSGEEALQYLRQQGPYRQALRPDILLLDLNARPGKRRELLSLVKQDPALREIPVVVLSNADSEQDALGSYLLFANAYVVKPCDPEQFRHVVEIVEDFWLTVVRLPPRRMQVA